MSKLKTLISILFITSSSFSTMGYALQGTYNIDAYSGVDTKIRRMEFKKNFGNKVFKDPFYTSLNIFVGCKMNQYFGIEAGYESSDKKFSSKRGKNGSSLFGYNLIDNIQGLDNITNLFNSRSKISGFNINLMGFAPINDERNINLIGSVGLANLRSKTVFDLFEICEKNIVLDDQDNINVQTFSHIRSIYKNRIVTVSINTGIQYLANQNFGIRALVGWENTDKIKIQGKDRETGKKVNEYAKFKDSITYRIGFFIPF